VNVHVREEEVIPAAEDLLGFNSTELYLSPAQHCPNSASPEYCG
jgi:hypothetical protein